MPTATTTRRSRKRTVALIDTVRIRLTVPAPTGDDPDAVMALPDLVVVVPPHTAMSTRETNRFLAPHVARHAYSYLPVTIGHNDYRADVNVTNTGDDAGKGIVTLVEVLYGAARVRRAPRTLGTGTVRPEDPDPAL